MYSLFIITFFIQILTGSGYFYNIHTNRKLILPKINMNNQYGSEYDIELSDDEKDFLSGNYPFIKDDIIISTNKTEDQEITKQIYLNLRKFNLLNRLLSNLNDEQNNINNELIRLGVDLFNNEEEDDYFKNI